MYQQLLIFFRLYDRCLDVAFLCDYKIIDLRSDQPSDSQNIIYCLTRRVSTKRLVFRLDASYSTAMIAEKCICSPYPPGCQDENNSKIRDALVSNQLNEYDCRVGSSYPDSYEKSKIANFVHAFLDSWARTLTETSTRRRCTVRETRIVYASLEHLRAAAPTAATRQQTAHSMMMNRGRWLASTATPALLIYSAGVGMEVPDNEHP